MLFEKRKLAFWKFSVPGKILFVPEMNLTHQMPGADKKSKKYSNICTGTRWNQPHSQGRMEEVRIGYLVVFSCKHVLRSYPSSLPLLFPCGHKFGKWGSLPNKYHCNWTGPFIRQIPNESWKSPSWPLGEQILSCEVLLKCPLSHSAVPG